MKCTAKHLCNCGVATHAPHDTGQNGCQRVMAKPPMHKPENAGTHSEWDIGTHSVSDYTLKWQRGYRQYSCGCWTKAKESTNSLPDEFG
jgi:hypothetical protein